MIDKENFHILNYIKREDYVGSMDGMRYMLRKKETESGEEMEVILWPEPFGFSRTEEKKKQRRYFPFSGEGLCEAVDWINEQLVDQRALWDIVK